MSKTKLVVTAGFLVAFGAGLVMGLWIRRPLPTAAPPAGERSWIARELDLSSQQEEKVKAIWSSAMGPRDGDSRRQALRKERDEAIVGMLGPAQKAAYERIGQDYQAKLDQVPQALRRERDEAVQALLSAEQKAQYERIVQGYQAKVEQLSQDRRKAFEAAVAQTKQVLNESQRQEYEDILKRRADRRGHGATTRADERATTRSASDPASHRPLTTGRSEVQ